MPRPGTEWGGVVGLPVAHQDRLATLVLRLLVNVPDVDSHPLRVAREPHIEKMTCVGQKLRKLVTRLAIRQQRHRSRSTATGWDAENRLVEKRRPEEDGAVPVRGRAVQSPLHVCQRLWRSALNIDSLELRETKH